MSYVSKPSRSSISKTLFLTSAITTVGFLSFAATAQAVEGLPSNGFVVNGSATLDYSQNDQLHVNATTDFVSINWNDFNIDAGHLTQFHQTSSSAMAVNRVVGAGADPTRILGTLKSNGVVMVLDRNGVIFGSDSIVDVGGIITSTGDVTDADILDDGKFEFSNFKADSQIISRGKITVAEAGLAAFVAPTVRNSGVIKAKMGRVAMAAGSKVTLDLYGDDLIEIAVDDKLADGLLVNTGEIKAAGGEVIVSAQIAKSAVDNVINMSGLVDVTSAKVQGGKIVLSGGTQGRVALNGNIKANGKKGQAAGSINATGESIVVTAAAEVKAKGKNGGDAGEIKLVADDRLSIRGLIHATGAEGTGFIETSAPNTFFAGTPSILANREWLLDPTDVVVDAAMETLIEGQLAIGDMTVQTPVAGTDDGNIDLNVVIDWATDKIFKLIADGNVNINGTGGINATGTGSFEAIAGNDVDVQGDITTQGGNVSLTAGDTANQDDIIIEAEINTNGGNFAALAGDDIFIRDDVNTGGGNVVITTLDNANVSNVSFTASGSVVSENGDITINSDDILLSTSGGATKLDAGTGTVEINRVSEGLIALGAATASASSGDIRLAQGELAAISAAKLVLGDADAATSKTTTINVTDVVLNTIPTVELNALATATNAVNFAGTNSFLALNAKANEINVTGGSTAGTSIHFDAPTTNLNGDLVSAAITGTSTTVNVQSDAAQIQDGVDVAATGATVNVAAGTFVETVNVGKTLSLLGANAGTAGNDAGRVAESIIESADNGINVTANGVTIDGFTVDGSKATTGSNGIEVTAADGFTAQNNIIQGYTDTGSGRAKSGYKSGIGILIDNSTGTINISDNVIDKNTDGIRVLDTDATAVGDVLVTKNDVTNNADKGIIINRSDRAQVTNNNATKNSFGIWLENSDNVLVNANTVKDSTQVGIRIRNQADSNIIRGNTIDGTGAEGILADQNSDTLTIVDNDIDNTKTAISLKGASNSIVRLNAIGLIGAAKNIDGHGIFLDGGSDVRLIDNDIQNTAESGISTNATTNTLMRLNDIDFTMMSGITSTDDQGLVVAENNIGLNGTKKTIGTGGVEVLRSNGAIIRDNDIKNTGQNGIRLTNTDDAVIRNNDIDVTNWNGITAKTGSDNLLVTQNRVGLTGGSNNIGTHGIKVEDGVDARIISNDVQNTKLEGVLLSNADTALVRDNDIDGAATDGVLIENGSDDAIVIDNRIGLLGGVDNIGGDGIAVDSSNNARVRENDVQNTVGNGIGVDNSDNAFIYNNNLNNIGDDAIDFDTVTNSVIRENKIGTKAGVDNIGDDGIDVATSTNITLFKNRIRNVVENGIDIFDSANTIIRENNIRFVGEKGVYVEGGDKVTLINNTVKDTGNDGIGTKKTDEVIARLNTVKDAGKDGFDIRGADKAVLVENTVNGADKRGIYTKNIKGTAPIDPALIIRDNTVKDTARNAIVADGFTTALINDNTVRDSRRSGIVAKNGDTLNARRNDVRDVNRDGFFIEDVDAIELVNNDVRRTGWDGAHIDGFETTLIERNDVRDTGDDGLEAINGEKVTILNNFLRRIGFVNAGANADRFGADAISVENVSGDDAVNKFSVDIQENDIKRTYDDAIDAAFVGRTIIKENTIKHVGGDNKGDFGGGDLLGADGISVIGAIDSKTGNRFDLKINKNTIDNTADDAIQSLLSGDTQVHKNTIINAGTSAGAGFTGGDGINILANPLEETRVSITKNEITDAEDDGIEVIGASDLTVDKNVIDGSGDDGINILGFNSFNGVTLLSSYDAVVTSNVVTNSGTDGIQSEGFTTGLIEGNEVSDSAEIGINVSGFNNGTTIVSDNTLTDNDIGLQFESGVADLTGTGNTFENGRVGIRFAPYDLAQPSLSSFIFRPGTGFADLSLVDDDGSEGFDGTIGAQTFDDQDLYVELANGALFEPGQPGIYNALDSTYLNTPFGDVTPSVDFLPDGFTAEQIEYFESKFTHFVDDNSLGLFFFPPDIDQERIFDQFDPANLGISGLNVTILGLPSLPGNVGAALNNIATFAGNGDGTDELAGLTPEQLNDIDTAAGGESTTCWTDAINNAENGITTDMEFTGTAEDLLSAESSCSL